MPSSKSIYCSWCHFHWGRRRIYERTNHFMSSWWIRCFPSMMISQFFNLQAGTGSSRPWDRELGSFWWTRCHTENKPIGQTAHYFIPYLIRQCLVLNGFQANGCVNLWHRLYVRSGMLPWKCGPSLHPQGKTVSSILFMLRIWFCAQYVQ